MITKKELKALHKKNPAKFWALIIKSLAEDYDLSEMEAGSMVFSELANEIQIPFRVN
ncbi:hypothetical protein LCGC14_0569890 [marine sediment metagenome]|uniref:Uncharacterized protein n=1 Tax=marine sediment metagenome TaxID=412755 RepID=A0A0F9S357_9ZZZZ